MYCDDRLVIDVAALLDDERSVADKRSAASLQRHRPCERADPSAQSTERAHLEGWARGGVISWICADMLWMQVSSFG